MSYQVLARKYRSATFDDLVGQEAIAATLKNAVATQRVHHGYLFTGTRGVGKTSTARILAKALNCQSFDAPSPTPCCECEACKAIAEGEDIDVVEIDAASNTGVDNIRELRSNATFRPARSRFKVYIIDEVHMLSTGAFNALLKTLEEPPAHVKFILATTELQKVPATIQSRCQRFTFRALSPDAIGEHLSFILKTESITAEEAVIRRIARLANGSMRDGLSLLDKVLSFEPNDLTMSALEQVLPPAHDELLFALVGHIREGDAGAALAKLDEALAGGQTVSRFCDGLIEYLRTLMLLRVCGSETELVDVSQQIKPRLVEQADAFDPQTFVYMITIVEELRRGAKYSGSGRALADATLVRLAISHSFADIGDLLASMSGPQRQTGHAASVVEKKKSSVASPVVTRRPEQPAARAGVASSSTAAAPMAGIPARSGGASEPVSQPGRGDPGETTYDSSGPRAALSSSERQKVADDPVVRRALELAEGTLVDIRRSIGTMQQDTATAEARSKEESHGTSPSPQEI